MNLKKQIPALVLITSSLLFMSCAQALEYEPYLYNEPKTDTKFDVQTSNYFQKKCFDSVTYLNEYNQEKNISSLFDYNQSKNKDIIKSRANSEAKLLVVPVVFNDVNEADWVNKDKMIKNAFFGTQNRNLRYSVSEYYMKSSYGDLKITGEVTKPIKTTVTITDKSSNSLVYKIKNDVLNQLVASGFDLSNYVVTYDDTKYLENVFFIYDYPHMQNPTSDTLWWAFSFNDKTLINNTNIYSNNCAWAAIDFTNLYRNTTDAKTYIHETGHLLGLDDYYSSDTIYQPLGGYDVMDLNLGDHTAFSKILLNWTTPKVVTNSGTISLKTFENSGEVIMIPAKTITDGNYHPYQEYLLLEYYTPDKLNDHFDEKYMTSSGKIFKYPSTPGIKIYHVDARLAYFTSEVRTTGSFIKFIDDDSIPLTSSHHVEYRYRNNNKRTADVNNTLYHLLERSGNNTFFNGEYANEDTVFRSGDSLSNYTFHSGATLQYKIEIKELTNNNASITFSKK